MIPGIRGTTMKKAMKIIIFTVLVLSLVSCSARKFDITVESPLEFYTPAISSVPGFPLRVILPDEGYYGEYAFRWRTDTGKFIDWDTEGRIVPLGRQAVLNDSEVFWTPFEGSESYADSAKLEIEVVRLEGGNVDARLKFNIEMQDDGLYILKPGK